MSHPFAQLLAALLSGDNNVRKNAETELDAAKASDPDKVVQALVEVLASSPTEDQRQQAAVLLRQCVLGVGKKEAIWFKLAEGTCSAAKQATLASVQRDSVHMVRRSAASVVSCIAEVIATDLDELNKEWSDLIPTLSGCVADGSDQASMVAALQILRELVPTIGTGLMVNPYRDQLSAMVQRCMGDQNPAVRAGGAQLVMQLIEDLPTELAQPLAMVIPKVLGVMESLVPHPDQLKDVIEAMCSAADEEPEVFEPQLENVWNAMLTLCRAKDKVNEECRRTAMEVNMTLLSSEDLTITDAQLEQVITLNMEWMVELDDDVEDWTNQADDEDDEEETCVTCGEENMDRIGEHCDEETVMNIIFKNVRTFFQAGSWKHSRAALMSVSQVVEYIEEEARIDQCVDIMKSKLGDDHPRVRFAALHAIGQVSQDHEPYVQDNHYEELLPAIVQAIDDPNTRVASNAINAFVNFGEELDQDSLLPYLDPLMQKIVQRLQSNQSRTMSENCLSGIAVVGDVAEELFEPYYGGVMPMLKTIVQNATGEKERTLRGKAFECISLVGSSVSKETFMPDAQLVMTEMIRTSAAGLAADDPQREYIHEAAERICQTLQKDFKPWVPQLLPGIFAILSTRPNEIGEDDDIDDDDPDLSLEMVGDKLVGLKTSVLNEMEQAVSLLDTFIKALGVDYCEFMPATCENLGQLLKFALSEDLRENVFKAWTSLTVAARDAVEEKRMQQSDLQQIVKGFLTATVLAMPGAQPDQSDFSFDQAELSALQDQSQGISNVVQKAGKGVLKPDEVKQLSDVVVLMLQRIETDRVRKHKEDGDHKKNKKKQIDDSDSDSDVDEEEVVATHESVRLCLADIVGSLLKSNREEFVQAGLPVFMQMVNQLITQGNSDANKALALYVADDIVDSLGEQSLPYWNSFMEPAGRLISESKSASVREYASSTIGHAARCASFAPMAHYAACQLAQLLQKFGERHRRRRAVKQDAKQIALSVDAAIRALGVVCEYQEQNVQEPARFWSLWLNSLPLRYDEDNGQKAHAQLLELLIQKKPLLVGANGEHVPRILAVLADVYQGRFSNEVLNVEMAAVVAQIGEQQLVQLANGLTDKQKKKLETMVKNHNKQG